MLLSRLLDTTPTEHSQWCSYPHYWIPHRLSTLSDAPIPITGYHTDWALSVMLLSPLLDTTPTEHSQWCSYPHYWIPHRLLYYFISSQSPFPKNIWTYFYFSLDFSCLFSCQHLNVTWDLWTGERKGGWEGGGREGRRKGRGGRERGRGVRREESKSF